MPKGIELVRGYTVGGALRPVAAGPLDAMIDTGAECSSIPAEVCRDEDGHHILRVIRYREVTDWAGHQSPAPVPAYCVWVKLAGLGPFELTPCETNRSCFIVGRDLLANVLLTLDGPSEMLGLRGTNAFERFLRRLLQAP